jgi:hypothetical protein
MMWNRYDSLKADSFPINECIRGDGLPAISSQSQNLESSTLEDRRRVAQLPDTPPPHLSLSDRLSFRSTSVLPPSHRTNPQLIAIVRVQTESEREDQSDDITEKTEVPEEGGAYRFVR